MRLARLQQIKQHSFQGLGELGVLVPDLERQVYIVPRPPRPSAGTATPPSTGRRTSRKKRSAWHPRREPVACMRTGAGRRTGPPRRAAARGQCPPGKARDIPSSENPTAGGPARAKPWARAGPIGPTRTERACAYATGAAAKSGGPAPRIKELMTGLSAQSRSSGPRQFRPLRCKAHTSDDSQITTPHLSEGVGHCARHRLRRARRLCIPGSRSPI